MNPGQSSSTIEPSPLVWPAPASSKGERDAVPEASPVTTMTAAIASGDRKAFAAFYDAYFDSMFLEAQRIFANDEQQCLDVVHDAMIRVIRQLRTPFSNDDALRAWLRRVVYSVSIDHLRAEQRRGVRNDHSASTNLENAGGDHKTIESQLAWLQKQLSELDDAQSRLLDMRYRFNWTLEQIGRALGLSTGAVDGRIGRTIRRLRSRAFREFEE